MKRPIGIAIISILNFLSGLYMILMGLGLATSGGYGFFSKTGFTDVEKGKLLGIGAGGIIYLVLGIITLIVAVALWKLKSWAWFLAFIITLISLAHWAYTGYMQGFSQDVIIHLVAYGLLTLYFLAVKKHFGASSAN